MRLPFLIGVAGFPLPGFHLDVARLPNAVGNFDVVEHLNGAGGLRHSRCGAFVLHHLRGAGPGGHAILDVNLKTVLANLRLGQFGLNGGFDFSVAELALAVRFRERRPGRQDEQTA